VKSQDSKRFLVAKLVAAGTLLSVTVAGCGHPLVPSAGHAPTAVESFGAPNNNDGDPTGGTVIPESNGGPGVPVASLSCPEFGSGGDIARAVATQVPTAKAVAVAESGDGGTSDGLTCSYNLYPAGTDTSSADRGEAQIMVTVKDVWDDTPLTGNQDEAHQMKAFLDDKKTAQANDGTTESNAKYTFLPSTGLGSGSYVGDTVHVDDAGTTQQFNDYVDVMRAVRPYNLEVSLSYVIPQPDEKPTNLVLDTIMKDRAQRTKLLTTVAGVLLDKLPES
jgi:hypothetical protein